MRCSLKSSLIGLAGLATAAAAAPAWAGCGDVSAIHPADWRPSPSEHLLQPVNLGAQSIVGLWSVQFIAGGAQVDFGYAAWHSDGTEIMNSGTRAPSTENFCMGVWAQTGGNSYQLTHYALSYDPTKAAAADGGINGRVVIREWVNLNGRGTQFTGTYTVDVYAPSGLGSPTRIAQGRITGDRLTVN